jgi:hypothetical protein
MYGTASGKANSGYYKGVGIVETFSKKIDEKDLEVLFTWCKQKRRNQTTFGGVKIQSLVG